MELARYKIGDSAWRVVLKPTSPLPYVSDEDEWMITDAVHPKILYDGENKSRWPYRALLPKLQNIDFESVVTLLTSDLVVEHFDVCEIARSMDTGEFYYFNSEGERMPESYLLDTRTAASRERSRIIRMIRRWAASQ